MSKDPEKREVKEKIEREIFMDLVYLALRHPRAKNYLSVGSVNCLVTSQNICLMNKGQLSEGE